MFFTMQEVVEKLSKTEEQIQELIQEGKLREFRDGTKLLFKVSEVEALAADLPRANDGEPDKNDWIETCDEQEQIYPLVIETIEYVESLME